MGLLPELDCVPVALLPAQAQLVAAGGWLVEIAAGRAQGGLWGHSWRDMTAHLALGAIKALFP